MSRMAGHRGSFRKAGYLAYVSCSAMSRMAGPRGSFRAAGNATFPKLWLKPLPKVMFLRDSRPSNSYALVDAAAQKQGSAG